MPVGFRDAIVQRGDMPFQLRGAHLIYQSRETGAAIVTCHEVDHTQEPPRLGTGNPLSRTHATHYSPANIHQPTNLFVYEPDMDCAAFGVGILCRGKPGWYEICARCRRLIGFYNDTGCLAIPEPAVLYEPNADGLPIPADDQQ